MGSALAAKQVLDDEHRRALSRQPERLTETEKLAVRRLAEDNPSIWTAASTTARDRQATARLMLDRIVILVIGETERAEVECRWAGGTVTRAKLTRPVRRFEQLERFDELLSRITDLREKGATAQAIADDLNAAGWAPPKKQAFDAPMVRKLLQRRGLRTKRTIWSGHVDRRNIDEVTLQELIEHLGHHDKAIEYVWQFMRDDWLSNHIFSSYENIVDHCSGAWNKLVDQPWTIMELGLRHWAHGF